MTRQRELREAALNQIEADVNRANDNNYAGAEATFLVRAIVEVGRILAGIEENLDNANAIAERGAMT